MKYTIGIDLGTSGTKTVLFDEKGTVIASDLEEYPLYQPHNGWAEQEPLDWWQAAVKTLKNVIKISGVEAADICGIGISGQMHGLVMLDDEGEVLRKSIIWCDQRTAAECREITERVGAERLIEITANPALTGFTACKILWVRNNEPHNYKRCRHILLPKDYLRYRLTGAFATDVSDASGMQLLDVKNRCWSQEILSKLEISGELLGRVYESPEVTGRISPEAAELTGLKAGTIVVGGAGDNASAAIGTGIICEGRAFTTIGTSGVVYAHTDNFTVDRSGRVHTFCCAVPGSWHVMGVTQAAGLSLQWFKKNFARYETEAAAEQGCDPYVLLDKEAESVQIGADKLFYMPYLMGERTPHLDPNCRGAFIGLSALHEKRHLVRAIMEGVAYSLKDCLQVLADIGINPNEMYACGGGAKSPFWRQMLADVFECSILRVDSNEGPALGAAILAAVGAEIYPNVAAACDAMIKQKDNCVPSGESSARYKRCYGVYKKLYPALKDIYSEMAEL